MTHDERVFYHMYTTCETPAEHAERIVALEELLADAMAALRVAEDELGRDVMVAHYPLLHIRMRELGVEVDNG